MQIEQQPETAAVQESRPVEVLMAPVKVTYPEEGMLGYQVPFNVLMPFAQHQYVNYKRMVIDQLPVPLQNGQPQEMEFHKGYLQLGEWLVTGKRTIQ